jgi:signal recognition particle receptor subunit beta
MRFRLVFAGPVGAGKTTAVRALSDLPPVDTDVPISAGSADYHDTQKTTTTVGLDYGVWKPTDEISVALVGFPGQHRFTHARLSAVTPGTRVLLWLDASRGTIAADADEWLSLLSENYKRLVVAISHCGDATVDGIRQDLAQILQKHALPSAHVLAVDARDREDVIRAACYALDLPGEVG